MKSILSKVPENALIPKLLACSVYLSEGKNAQLLQHFKHLANSNVGVLLVNTFIDEPYNRSSYTFASSSVDKVIAQASLLPDCAAHPHGTGLGLLQ